VAVAIAFGDGKLHLLQAAAGVEAQEFGGHGAVAAVDPIVKILLRADGRGKEQTVVRLIAGDEGNVAAGGGPVEVGRETGEHPSVNVGHKAEVVVGTGQEL